MGLSVSDRGERRFHGLACLAIVLTGLVVYSNTIHSSFHFDDYHSIVDNAAIKDVRNIPQFLFTQRGVVQASFALNYYLSGLSVEGYHWTNICIHLLNGVLVYFLAIIILNQYISETRIRGTSRVPVLALFVALLFITSPVQTHTVNYVVERNGELASTFYLLSFVFFARAVSISSVSIPFYVLSIVFFLISTYCKEFAYTSFIMMFLFYLCFVSRDWHGWPRSLKLVLPYIAWAYMRTNGMETIPPPLGLKAAKVADVDTTTAAIGQPWEYLLTQTVVIMEYIKLLAWPLPSKLNIDYDVTLVTTIWEPSTAISAVVTIGLLCFAFIFLNRARLLAFSILWFLVVLLPNSGFFPQGVRELMVCYRLYLPSLAFYLLLVVGVHKVFRYVGEWKGVEPRRLYLAELATLIAIVFFYGICTYGHNKVWKTEVSLWEDTVRKSPNKIRPRYNLGKAYELDELLDKAEVEYMRCIEMFKATPRSRRHLGMGSYYHASLALAGIYSQGGKHTEAIDLYRECLKTVYWKADGHNNLGLTYYRAGLLEEAEREFRLAIELDPGLSIAYENLGALCEVKGEMNAALAAFTEAVMAGPKNAKAHIRLGQLWWNYKKRPDMALMHLNAALKSDLDKETLKRVLLAIDIIKKQASQLLRPHTEKDPW